MSPRPIVALDRGEGLIVPWLSAQRTEGYIEIYATTDVATGEHLLAIDIPVGDDTTRVYLTSVTAEGLLDWLTDIL